MNKPLLQLFLSLVNTSSSSSFQNKWKLTQKLVFLFTWRPYHWRSNSTGNSAQRVGERKDQLSQVQCGEQDLQKSPPLPLSRLQPQACPTLSTFSSKHLCTGWRRAVQTCPQLWTKTENCLKGKTKKQKKKCNQTKNRLHLSFFSFLFHGVITKWPFSCSMMFVLKGSESLWMVSASHSLSSAFTLGVAWRPSILDGINSSFSISFASTFQSRRYKNPKSFLNEQNDVTLWECTDESLLPVVVIHCIVINKVAASKEDWLVFVDLNSLHMVGRVTVNDIHATIDQLVGKLLELGGRSPTVIRSFVVWASEWISLHVDSNWWQLPQCRETTTIATFSVFFTSFTAAQIRFMSCGVYFMTSRKLIPALFGVARQYA